MIVLFTYLIGVFIFPILLVILNKSCPSLDISYEFYDNDSGLLFIVSLIWPLSLLFLFFYILTNI